MKDMTLRAAWIMVILFVYVKASVCEPRATEAALICSNRTAASSDRQVFLSNFLASMASVSSLVDIQKYGLVANGTGNNTVYAYGECMKDLSQNDCSLCFARCRVQILDCLPFQRSTTGGRLFYDGCYLRYDDYAFSNESLSSDDRTVCGTDEFVGNRSLFRESVLELAKSMSMEGIRDDGFFTGFVSRENLTVYGLAQCWESVSGDSCGNCLENAASRIGSCPPRTEGRALNAGCYIRYSTTRFYNNSQTDSSPREGKSHHGATVIASVCGAVAFLLFVALISLFARKKILKQRTADAEKKRLGAIYTRLYKSKLNVSYETLERATNYFHDSNKLGQGGSGSVYKARLPGGKTVAVKRLFFSTTQWTDHFFNEVNLISGIDHKNLVKLLGCSITGPESLLVYEYMPNQSLHDHLFARKDVLQLGWEARYKILLGTAEGLAFLHEESKLRIIHRDIKLSNVLLDEEFTPKIADFDLARLFPHEETHITTALAGTLGYLAPEYAFGGRLTEKADVYGYGVLAIEVVTGMSNSQSVVRKVWDLYGLGKLTEAIDPSIKNEFPEELARRLLQISLNCVQASPELRPSMSTVVKMLSNNHDIPLPMQPPFLSSGSPEISPLNQSQRYILLSPIHSLSQN